MHIMRQQGMAAISALPTLHEQNVTEADQDDRNPN
jgi:hypothetical protein